MVCGVVEHGISIHAPAQGATPLWVVEEALQGISTHAPVQGVTGDLDRFQKMLKFQLTHPCKVRLILVTTSCRVLKFQLTYPCRVRHNDFALTFAK